MSPAAALIAGRAFNRPRVGLIRPSVAGRDAKRGSDDYRRRKRQADPEYAQVVRDSRRKWREAHPDYQKAYWLNHPEAAARNKQQQHQRDQKRRVGLLVKNTLVLDLKHSAAEIWLVGPLAQDLVKNTLVSSKLLILQSPPTAIPLPPTS
ncbi:MAG: hypothetical protein JO051_13570 [Acidobacteriaceae bacterium]|nr:hypothetical protein [Acidobacteriaceae bacterium]